jgi:ABC-type uncharacterized transport system permease subunit
MESQAGANTKRADKKTPSVPRRREKKARRSVLIADAIADRTIRIGGILVIVAVLGILVFLVAETFPLFKSGAVTSEHSYSIGQSADDVLSVSVDDYKTFAFFLTKAAGIPPGERILCSVSLWISRAGK